MKIISCGKGDIEIQLDEDFSNIIIHAFGEMILDYKGFCISINSIQQIAPTIKKLSNEEKKKIAEAIAENDSLDRPIEFYEGL